jgi:hypothetical protein
MERCCNLALCDTNFLGWNCRIDCKVLVSLLFLVERLIFVADIVPRYAPPTCLRYNTKNVEGSASPSSPRTSKIFLLKVTEKPIQIAFSNMSLQAFFLSLLVALLDLLAWLNHSHLKTCNAHSHAESQIAR